MKNTSLRNQRGFSLLEIIVVVSMALVIAVVAVPNIMTMVRNSKLRSASNSAAGLLQTARIRAIKDNNATVVLTANASGANMLYVDVNNNNQLDTGEPQIQFGSKLNVQLAGRPSLATMGLGFNPISTSPRFNSQGQPCMVSGAACVPNNPLTNARIGYVMGITNGSGGWSAVVVFPGGRMKTFFWTGTRWGS